MRKSITAVFLVALVVGAVSAARAQPVKLEYKFKENDLDQYKISMAMNLQMPSIPGGIIPPSLNMSVNSKMRQRVIAVNPDGSAKVRVRTGDFEMTAPGLQMPKQNKSLESTVVVMTMTKDGRVLRVEGLERGMGELAKLGFDPQTMLNQMAMTGVFPDKPVSVGDTWTQQIPSPFGGGSFQITGTLLSYPDSLWGLKTARIKYDMSGKMDLGDIMRSFGRMMASQPGSKEAEAMSSMSGEMSFAGSMVYDFATELGKLLNGSGTSNMQMAIQMPAQAVAQGAPSQMNATADMTMSITRFK
ncbi:MAG: hypothetical protein A2Z18_11295 [Armatimonadetes bacterium RBG_16_58_9]|nr:MAG: hypothetical protein A2Z18_11295 [Armatimonadetes bacterium RBG_16_58_9]